MHLNEFLQRAFGIELNLFDDLSKGFFQFFLWGFICNTDALSNKQIQ